MGIIPTLPVWTAGQVVTKAQMDQANAYSAFWSNPPRSEVRMQGDMTIPHALDTWIPFDTNSVDVVQPGDSPMHSTTADQSRIYVRTTGRYLVSAHVFFDRNATGGFARDIRIIRNGTRYASFYGSASQPMVVAPPTSMQLAAGDYLELAAFQNSGSAMTLQAEASGRRWVALMTVELVGV